LFDDEAVEIDDPMGWEPLTYEIDRTYFENETGIPDAGPVQL
jgi:hypothetical protein